MFGLGSHLCKIMSNICTRFLLSTPSTRFAYSILYEFQSETKARRRVFRYAVLVPLFRRENGRARAKLGASPPFFFFGNFQQSTA